MPDSHHSLAGAVFADQADGQTIVKSKFWIPCTYSTQFHDAYRNGELQARCISFSFCLWVLYASIQGTSQIGWNEKATRELIFWLRFGGRWKKSQKKEELQIFRTVMPSNRIAVLDAGRGALGEMLKPP